MLLKFPSCWLWVSVGGDFLSRLTDFVVSVWLEGKGAQEYYSSYKNPGLCSAGFGFPGHPVLNYSLKASAQLLEFVWIDREAERVTAKTLELFVSLQFIHIKLPVRVWNDSNQVFSVFLFDTIAGF